MSNLFSVQQSYPHAETRYAHTSACKCSTEQEDVKQSIHRGEVQMLPCIYSRNICMHMSTPVLFCMLYICAHFIRKNIPMALHTIVKADRNVPSHEVNVLRT